MNHWHSSLSIFSTTVILIATTAMVADPEKQVMNWPQFHGPNGDGITADYPPSPTGQVEQDRKCEVDGRRSRPRMAVPGLPGTQKVVVALVVGGKDLRHSRYNETNSKIICTVSKASENFEINLDTEK